MTENSKLPQLENKSALAHKKGKIGIKYQRIAFLVSKGGLSTKQIAEDVGISESRLYKILETRQDVWDEINRLTVESFKGSERFVATLLEKALASLEDQMVSGTADERKFAIDRVLKFFQKGDDKKTLIAQFFGGGGAGTPDAGRRLDEIILQKRRERGLPDFPAEEDL
jgi:hypothetical protein